MHLANLGCQTLEVAVPMDGNERGITATVACGEELLKPLETSL